jgi:hypothetical protein
MQADKIVRFAANGGVPTNKKCSEKGAKSKLPYTGSWAVLSC